MVVNQLSLTALYYMKYDNRGETKNDNYTTYT